MHYDLGVLRAKHNQQTLTLSAPGPLTRVVWGVCFVGCLVFLWALALSMGWVMVGSAGVMWVRLPVMTEWLFGLLPLVLAVFSFLLMFGGVTLVFQEECLLMKGIWPRDSREVLAWSAFRYARFWQETHHHEPLFAMRFVFAHADVTCRVANEQVWLVLQQRFMTRV